MFFIVFTTTILSICYAKYVIYLIPIAYHLLDLLCIFQLTLLDAVLTTIGFTETGTNPKQLQNLHPGLKFLYDASNVVNQ